MKNQFRLLTLALAFVLMLGAVSGLLSMWALAAEDDQETSDSDSNSQPSITFSDPASSSEPETLPKSDFRVQTITPYRTDNGNGSGISGKITKSSEKFHIKIEVVDRSSTPAENPYAYLNTASSGIVPYPGNNDRYGEFSEPSTVTINGKDYPKYTITFKNLSYNGENNRISFDIVSSNFAPLTVSEVVSQVSNSNSTGNNSGGTSTGDNDLEEIANPDIAISSVVASDRNGNTLKEITEDTDPFKVAITFTDYGLMKYAYSDYSEDMQVMITGTSGLKPGSTNRGVLKAVSGLSSSNTPRFTATFENLTYDGTVSPAQINFRVQYLIDDEWVGTDATAILYDVKTKDDKDDLKPLIPHIIVSQYSYGDEQIPAGGEFNLDITFRNTSNTLPLDNIVMTITPQTIAETTSSTSTSANGGITITSASNTTYIEHLPVGGSMTHSIGLRAEPNAAVGSHKVTVSFSFQYIDEANKVREESEDKEEIAIPVKQIDRFSVDPITEYSDVIMAGEEGYVTVSFANKGQTNTLNITGVLQGDFDNAGSSQYFGHLENGKSDAMDFEIISYEPGYKSGEILVTYEDENQNINEILLPFNVTVEEPWVPPMDEDMYGEFEIEEPQTTPVASIVLCILGGLLMAVPLALYLFKRVKAKGIEDLDEVF